MEDHVKDALRAYNYTGSFYSELFYIYLYNDIPSKFDFDIETKAKLDTTKITLDPIKHLFKNIEYVRVYTNKSIEDPDTGDDLDDDAYVIPDWASNDRSAYLTVAADHRVFCIKCNNITCYYPQKDNIEEIENIVYKIYDCIPKEELESDAAKIKLIKFQQGDYYTEVADINKVNVCIEENYNDDFLPVYNDILKFLGDRSSGLVLLSGKVGTGKTNLIRFLINTFPKSYIIVPNSIAVRLGDPDLISFITSNKNAVFILEDCEQILEDRNDNPFNNAISTILNMADGLLSDVVNIKFICTFNANINKIDQALLRKGRCAARYEFGDLCEEKVAALNEKYNLGINDIKPMTLAEIYNCEKRDYAEDSKKRTKIGF